jgi:hypothetical protein
MAPAFGESRRRGFAARLIFRLFFAYTGVESLKLYLVSFEFTSEHLHPSVGSHLRQLNAEQILGHQWAVRTTFSAEQLKNRFRRFMADADRLTVVEVGEEHASRRALADIRKL